MEDHKIAKVLFFGMVSVCAVIILGTRGFSDELNLGGSVGKGKERSDIVSIKYAISKVEELYKLGESKKYDTYYLQDQSVMEQKNVIKYTDAEGKKHVKEANNLDILLPYVDVWLQIQPGSPGVMIVDRIEKVGGEDVQFHVAFGLEHYATDRPSDQLDLAYLQTGVGIFKIEDSYARDYKKKLQSHIESHYVPVICKNLTDGVLNEVYADRNCRGRVSYISEFNYIYQQAFGSIKKTLMDDEPVEIEVELVFKE